MAMPDDKPQSKTYWVTGTSPVLEHQPGEEFKAALDPEQEAFFLAGGHLSLEKPVEELEGEEPHPLRKAPPGAPDDNPEGDKE